MQCQMQLERREIPVKSRGAYARWQGITPEHRSQIMRDVMNRYYKSKPRFTQEQIQQMNKMAETMTYAQIASHFSIHPKTVFNYLTHYPKIGKVVIPMRNKSHKWDRVTATECLK